jgi:hypothetical protein
VTALAIAGLASTACVVLIFLLAARDRAPVAAPRGPGRPQSAVAPGDPPTFGAHRTVALRREDDALGRDALLTALAAGDVVLFYGSARPPARLRALQRAVAGPFDPDLAAAGQAIVLSRRPGTHGVLAAAWRRLLHAPGAGDPGLRAFAETWLGKGASPAG